ncbi:MAG TPA: bifunctional homocysteine S-methyltransferase/methylenetetrahydrofolate reductase [Bacillota bacterium]
MSERTLLERLERGVVLADGAQSTMLDASAVGGLPELLNLSDRRQVEELHLAYIRAGAQVIQTNTFACNRVQLEPHGLAAKVWELNVWGAKIARAAREVAGKPVLIAGTLGPLAPLAQGLGPYGPSGPLGRLPEAVMRDAYREQVEALLAGGVEAFIVETQADAREAAAAVNAVRAACRLPVVVTFSFDQGETTLAGQSADDILTILDAECAALPEVLGVNCGLGPAHALQCLRRLRAAGWDGWLGAMPNAGPLARVAGRHHYLGNPDSFVSYLTDLRAAGARLIGGCCGTTPAYIAALRRALQRLGYAPEGEGDTPGAAEGGPRRAPSAIAAGGSRAGVAVAEPVVPAPPGAGEPEPSLRLRDKLGRQFVISVELDPPKGTVVTKFVQGARRLAEAGVDCINVGDSPMARVRMGALTGAFLIQSQAGVETIVHFTTRDRNLMAIQADLLSAHALGIRNVLALTGDNPSLGDTRASAVYDVDSIGLIEILRELNRGRDVAGNSTGQPTDFTIACALSPNAEDLERELERFRRKLEAGVDFVMTQPLYAVAPLLRVLERTGPCPVPVLLGVMPLHSYRHALYLHEHVPGISIPAHVLKALEGAGDRGLEVGMELAEQVIEAARPWIDGVYVVLSFGQVEPVARFVERLRAHAATRVHTVDERRS